MNAQAGKGDTYRPVDQRKYAENYDRIFRKPPQPGRKLSFEEAREKVHEQFSECFRKLAQH